ncbi:MAG: hypothetical protein WDN01_10165 [Rhizomicrobium sp.]
MRRIAVLTLALLSLAAPARGDDDADLGRIPPPANPSAPLAPAASLTGIYYVQDDLASYAVRSALAVPLPPAPSPSWEERLFLDARLQWRLNDALSLHYSGRLNLRAEDDLPFPGHENIRHDLREAYLAWDAGGGLFLEAGRINLKSGVALGFNPTDYFKTRAVVEPLSADPSVLREDRLGTLMVLGQGVWNGFSLTVALAPKIARLGALYAHDDLPSFDPMFDRTNARTRFLAKASVRLADDLSPEILFYGEGGDSFAGFDLTRAFGKSVIGYIEWSGGERRSLVADALASGIATHALPPPAAGILPHDDSRAFRSDLAVGASYATADEFTFDLEYHYHQAGFSGADWRDWFATGATGDDGTRGALWFIRGYAADRQEPVARSSVFFRAAWADAFVHDLGLTGFILADTRDGSGLAQFDADYVLSRTWQVGGLVDATFGGRRSDYGSIPEAANALIRISHYF